MKRIWQAAGGLGFVIAGAIAGWSIAKHIFWAPVIVDAVVVAALIFIVVVTRGMGGENLN